MFLLILYLYRLDFESIQLSTSVESTEFRANLSQITYMYTVEFIFLYGLVENCHFFVKLPFLVYFPE